MSRFAARLLAPAIAVSLCTVAMPALAAPPSPTVTPDASAPEQLALDKRKAKRVRNIGIGSFGFGVLMIGVGAGLEHKRRTDICKETLSEDHEKACDDSLQANVSVLAMGSGFLVGGIVLAAIGAKRLRALRSNDVAFAPQVGRGFAGISLSGRF